MPCHHKLERYLDKYIQATGIEKDCKGPLFCSALGKTQTFSDRPISRFDAWAMVRRRGKDAEIETKIGNHIFGATGITSYLSNGGRIEVAQRMAEHANAKTTDLCRRSDDISISEIERLGILITNINFYASVSANKTYVSIFAYF